MSKVDLLEVCKQIIELVPEVNRQLLNNYLHSATQTLMYTAPETIERRQHEVLYRLVKMIETLELNNETLDEIKKVVVSLRKN